MKWTFSIVLAICIFCVIVLSKKPKHKKKHKPGSTSDVDQDVDEDTCNATSIFTCNITDSVDITNSNETSDIDKPPMGIDLEKLARNISDIRKLLNNDTELDYLLLTTPQQDRLSWSGSYILAVLSKTRYDNLTAPSLFADIPVGVNFAVYINSLSGIDTTRMEYTADIELTMQWRDVRLIHEFEPYILIKQKNIIERIWRPDPYFINEKDATLVDVTFPNMKMAIFPEGEVVYVIRMILTVACPMVFCRYPHDIQQCDFRIGSIAYSLDVVDFSWVNDSAVELNRENRLPEYYLNELKAGTCVNAGKIVTSSCLRVSFNLKRSLESHLLRKYVPSVMAMIFSWSALYAPWYLEEVKIVNPVVVLLTLKQLQRADESLPPVSYVTPLDIWFSTVQAFTILALVEAVFYYSFMKRRERYRKQAKINTDKDEAERLMEKGRSYKRRAEYIEDTSKFLFPILFIVFLILYVTIIAPGDQTSCVSKSILSAISESVDDTP